MIQEMTIQVDHNNKTSEVILPIESESQFSSSGMESQIQTARANPRDPGLILKKAVALATVNPVIANQCGYKIPRGKGDIEGFSVRLAEILLSCWGNLRVMTRIVGNDGKSVTAEATVWDMEENTAVCEQAQRSITNANGGTYSNDMIVMTANAARSIAMRNAIFRIIPRAYSKFVYDEAMKAAKNHGAKDIFQGRMLVMERFERLGVGVDKILKLVGKSQVSSLTEDDIHNLAQYWSAISGGDATVEEVFGEKTAPDIDAVPANDDNNPAEDRLFKLINSVGSV